MAAKRESESSGTVVTPPRRRKKPGDVQFTSSPPWDCTHRAVWVERDSAKQIVMLRHPTYPYAPNWDGSHPSLQILANEYVKSLYNNLPDLAGREWLPDLWNVHEASDANDKMLQWLPLLHSGTAADPRHSAVVRRQIKKRREISVVLLACIAWRNSEQNPEKVLYGGEGIRVISNLSHDPNDPKSVKIRFTSFASTLPPYPRIEKSEVPSTATLAFVPTLEFLATFLATIFSLPAEGQALFSEIGIRLGDSHGTDGAFELSAKTVPLAFPTSQDVAISYGLIAKLANDGSGGAVARYPLAAFANIDAQVFSKDPMTGGGPGKFRDYRPNRSWKTLDTARDKVTIGNLLAGKKGRVQLANADSYFKVVNSTLVPEDRGLPDDDAKQVSPPVNEHSRTNLFAAVTACFHVDDLFQRMGAFGIDPNDYFRFAALPLTVRYRAGIVPGPGHDGRTTNAQVLWLTESMTKNGVLIPGELETRFALADLQSSIEYSPLGVVTDQRWCWHEFSHVLICAATGDLEYRFAHSSGDAMGAILCDPYSRLATDTNWRSVTFPWVGLPARRHDRNARQGWSWSGSLYGKERTYAHGLCDRRGYWSEQMLSTTLFNIYRSLGGDSDLGSAQGTATADIRDAASAYTLCLIMQANQFLGPVAVTPVKTPDGFATALISADIAIDTFEWNGTIRCGGSAHKVIRWAFENQGLYQTSNSHDAPGAPPPVDIFIADQRALIYSHPPETRLLRGGYDPAPLDTTSWHTTDDWLWVQPHKGGKKVDKATAKSKNYAYVKIGNRGHVTAMAVEATVWCAKLTGGALPPWPDAAWTELPGPGTSADIPGTKTKKFGPFLWDSPQAGTSYALLAIATCADDRSNADTATMLPCATSPGRTDYLVACDNNLGLRRIDVA